MSHAPTCPALLLSVALHSLIFCAPSTAHAAARPDPLLTRCVLTLPGESGVTVREDLTFRTRDGVELGWNCYLPPAASAAHGARFPLVIFVNAGGNWETPLRRWEIYRSWGRLTAASGMVAVTHDARADHGSADLADFVAHLREHAAEFSFDPDNTGLWACSAHVTTAFPFAMDASRRWIRAAVFYYGSVDTTLVRTDLPVRVVRSGLDNQFFNASIAKWAGRAIAMNAPVTVVNLRTADHAFDAIDDDDASRAEVRATLAFLAENLSPSVQRGHALRERRAEALALYGRHDWATAAERLAEWAAEDPWNLMPKYNLAACRHQLGEYDRAAAGFAEVGDAGWMRGVSWYNAACAYALAGDRARALDYLTRAVTAPGAPEPEDIWTDPDLASLHGDAGFRRIAGPAGARQTPE